MRRPEEVLAVFGITPTDLEPITQGLINRTYAVQSGPQARFVLQRVNPIFPRAVHADIEAVTEHLAAKGLITPRMIRTPSGELFVEDEDATWRLMTFVPGRTFEQLETPAIAEAAGRLLAQFHAAVCDLEHEFLGQRVGVHDTDRHLEKLSRALEAHQDHQLYPRVRSMSDALFEIASRTPRFHQLPKRIVHGDPKINNLIFDEQTGEGRCLIDLDTVGLLELPIELGDAFRSWCNPAGESSSAVSFDLDAFERAFAGYASGAAGFMSAQEIDAVPDGIQLIITELSTRFATDALNESYFGWDPERFATRGEHNLLRAEGQLALVEDFIRKRAEVERMVHSALPR